MSKVTKAFSDRLRETRAKRGWTQEELALRMGYSQEYVSLLESGIRVPSFACAEAAARAFGMKLVKFVEAA